MTIQLLFDEILSYSRKSFPRQRLITFYNSAIEMISQEKNFSRFFKAGLGITGSDSTTAYAVPSDAREITEIRTSLDISDSANNLVPFTIRETSFIVDSSFASSTNTFYPFYFLFPTELTIDNIDSNLTTELPRNLKNAILLGMKIQVDIDLYGSTQLFPLFDREIIKVFSHQDSRTSFAPNGTVVVNGNRIQYF